MSISTGYLSRRRTILASLAAAALGVGALATIALQAADAAEGDGDHDETEVAADDADDGELSTPASRSLETFDVVLSRDPFDPVRPPEQSEGGGAEAVEQTSATGGSTQTGEQTSQPVEQTGTTGSSGCRTTETVRDGQVVTVLSTVIGGDTAIIQVDSTVYEVAEGDVFADNFAFVRVDANGCAVIQHGDTTFSQAAASTSMK